LLAAAVGVRHIEVVAFLDGQDIIESKLDKRCKGVYGPPIGKKCITFINDLNVPNKETYGVQPPIEILRQYMDHSGWFELRGKISSRLKI